MIVWSSASLVEVLSRADDGAWASSAEVFEGRDAVVLLPAIAAEIALAEVYAGLTDADLPD